MSTSTPDVVTTGLGRLRVARTGAGSPVLLWHSLFVDSRSWGGLVDAFAARRSVITVDGPGHGGSAAPARDFTLADCADAAADVLDALGIDEPVDWVGNAWGGHVGIVFAAGRPERIRTLTTIGTPVRALSRWERRTRVAPLVALYRLAGANGVVTRALGNALIGAQALAAEPERAERTLRAFADADRAGMLRAMRSVMLNRKSVEHLLPAVTAPTLMLAARDDPMGWSPADAERATAAMPSGRALAVRGSGHVAPLLLDPGPIADAVVALWGRALGGGAAR